MSTDVNGFVPEPYANADFDEHVVLESRPARPSLPSQKLTLVVASTYPNDHAVAFVASVDMLWRMGRMRDSSSSASVGIFDDVRSAALCTQSSIAWVASQLNQWTAAANIM
jgi:hypothetical protein